MALWQIVLAIWFLAWGLLAVTNFAFEQRDLIMGLLAIAVAILLVFRR